MSVGKGIPYGGHLARCGVHTSCGYVALMVMQGIGNSIEQEKLQISCELKKC